MNLYVVQQHWKYELSDITDIFVSKEQARKKAHALAKKRCDESQEGCKIFVTKFKHDLPVSYTFRLGYVKPGTLVVVSVDAFTTSDSPLESLAEQAE